MWRGRERREWRQERGSTSMWIKMAYWFPVMKIIHPCTGVNLEWHLDLIHRLLMKKRLWSQRCKGWVLWTGDQTCLTVLYCTCYYFPLQFLNILSSAEFEHFTLLTSLLHSIDNNTVNIYYTFYYFICTLFFSSSVACSLQYPRISGLLDWIFTQ